MRKVMWLALASVLVVAGTTVFAWPSAGDDPPPPPASRAPAQPGHDQLQKLFKRLDLSKEQTEKVHTIFKAHHEAVRKFMEKAHADLLKDVKSILTREQFQEFEKEVKRHHPGAGSPAHKGSHDKDRSGKPKPPAPPAPPAERD
jgi:Spy/CpxP family protein refolding chaperone